MLVKELITLLMACDPDDEVLVPNSNLYNEPFAIPYLPVTEIDKTYSSEGRIYLEGKE